MFERTRRPEPVDALFCVAIVSELAPILSLLHGLRLRSHRLCVGGIGQHRVAVLRCGVGPEPSERRARAALERISPRTVWSIGSCGALVDTLPVGAVVTAREVRAPDSERLTVSPVPGLPQAMVHTVARPVMDAEHRSRLARTGARVCEMEAASIARAAGGRCPVHLVKVVSDLAGGTPDPAMVPRSKRAQALFHQRVEQLMRTVVVPQIAGQLSAALALTHTVPVPGPTG